MIRFPLRRIGGLALVCALAAGCSSLLDPRPDPSRFYVLDPTAAPEPAEETLADDGTSVGLGPVRIADYLRRPEMVTRTGASEIEPSNVDRWGESLDQGPPGPAIRDTGMEQQHVGPLADDLSCELGRSSRNHHQQNLPRCPDGRDWFDRD